MNPHAWVEAVFELIWKVATRILLWGGLAYVAFRIRTVIIAVLLAAVLTYAVLPIVDFLCSYKVKGVSRKFQRALVTLVVFITLGALVVVSTYAIITPLSSEFKSLTTKAGDYFAEWHKASQKWYASLPPDVQSFLRQQKLDNLIAKLQVWISKVVAATVNFFSHVPDVILVPVLAFYFTLDSRILKREFVALAPRRHTKTVLAIIREINCIMRSYVIGQIILCIIAGVIVAIMLKALDMPYVLILSIFAGLTRAIPVVGPIISGIAIVLFGLAKAPLVGFYLLGFFSALHFVESKFIMPYLIGERMKLHPAIVIVVLLIGAEFFGIFGMFMAAPAAAILRVLVRHYLIKPKGMRTWSLPHKSLEKVEEPIQSAEATPRVDSN
jgi:predicted PurR-regulated permease PerM